MRLKKTCLSKIKQYLRITKYLFITLLLVSTSSSVLAQNNINSEKPNILILIGDDMGVESLATFGVGKKPPTTKNLDALAQEGVSFTNFWSQPVCSPTRATILTGRYGFRNGIGKPLGVNDGKLPELLPKPKTASVESKRKAPPSDVPQGELQTPGAKKNPRSKPKAMDSNESQDPALSLDEFTFPLVFGEGDLSEYKTAAIGKWHLADKKNGWLEHPNTVGFDYYSGLIGGFPEGYFSWIQIENGVATPTTGYTPNQKVEDAARWIKQRGEDPWLLWLAFNLPHDPLHLPPENLLQEDHSDLNPQDEPSKNPHPYFKTMMETLDTKIGHLLANIDPKVLDNTYIIFLGDNGTERSVVEQPFSTEHAKGSLYQGGINVPLIISGPGVVEGQLSTALVNSVDLFSTIIEMTGTKVSSVVSSTIKLDSVSALPYLSNPDMESIRDFAFADTFSGLGDKRRGNFTIRNATHKLISFKNGERYELYNLKNDPYEHNDLLNQKMSAQDQAQFDALKKQSTELQAL